MKLRLFSIILVIIVLFVSCFEEDERVPPYPGIVSTIKWNIEDTASYFDLESNTIVKSDPSGLWQLGFECGPEGWHIIVNSGASWLLYNTKQTDLLSVYSFPSGFNGLYDVQSAYPDSTAAGSWLTDPSDGISSKKEVYLLGKINGINYSEVKKIIFLNVDDSSYQFFYSEEKTGVADTITISKTDTANFVYYSFNKRQQLNAEPHKSSYDLVFCPYYDLAALLGQTIPYLVRGVLLNTWETTAVIDSFDRYNNITAETLVNYEPLPKRDAIGYRWKDVIVDQGSVSAVYTVKLNYTYLIHTSEGNIYKLRFLSYMLGDKSGYPQFEYQFLRTDFNNITPTSR
jgi:hypothetical protein